MKTILIATSFLTSFSVFSHVNCYQVNYSVTITPNTSTLVRGIDISKVSTNEQGLINYIEALSDLEALEFFKSFSNGEILLKEENESEILVEEIKIGCGNNFFSESENQHAMIVRGKWCGNSYFWTPISMGTLITEEAFRNNELFTGECVDRDSLGNLIAKYSFNNGKMISLVHFQKDGKIFQDFTFDNGIPNGISIEYDRQGTLRFKRTYEQGVLNGPFYEIYYTDDPDCQKRVDEGNYTNNEKLLIKSVCN